MVIVTTSNWWRHVAYDAMLVSASAGTRLLLSGYHEQRPEHPGHLSTWATSEVYDNKGDRKRKY